MVLDKMSRLVIDRALNGAPSNPWPRWEEMLGIGAAGGFTGAPRAAAQTASAQNRGRARESSCARSDGKMSSGTSPIAGAKDPAEHWHALLRPQVAESQQIH